jgi:L-alanine-DL-glutamate epimerase-like enolase superfamily enzyme
MAVEAVGVAGTAVIACLLPSILRYRAPDEGYVHDSDQRGLGQDINWEYVMEHQVKR